MAKVVTVVGATGIQGGSVISALQDDPAYSIRAITRNTQSDAAKELVSKGVSVIEANLDSVESLKSAFAGSHAIFAVTNFFEDLVGRGIEGSMQAETSQGINLANAAAATKSLEHYIWSTLPNSRQNTDGQCIVQYYESKNRVDSHIKSIPHLLEKTTFLWLGWYSGNMLAPFYKPQLIETVGDPKMYVQLSNISPSTLLPILGDERKNTGLLVRNILAQPNKTLPGRFVAGVISSMPLGDVLAAFASAQKIEARCLQISKEQYADLWPFWGELLAQSNQYLELMGSKAFSHSEESVVTPKDLGVEGLVGVAEAFKVMPALFK